MAIRSRLAVDGLREATTRVDEIGERARRPEPALRARATRLDLQESERRRFTSRRGWRPATPAWVAEKRRRGLDPRTMRATNRLSSALINAVRSEGVRHDVFNAEMRWGITSGRSNVFYAQALAKQGWRVVVIDRAARASIATRVERYVAYDLLER